MSTTATATSALSVRDQIRQLDDARKLVLQDTSYYPQIVQGILPLLAPGSVPELRRWGADFLAEAFSTPALPSGQKETLSLLVLETLKGLVVGRDEDDLLVLRPLILTAASVYPLALRWVINNSYDTATWERLTAVKTRILRLWDVAPPSVRICCIKFAQRVVLAQTVAGEQDSRRGDVLKISLSMIPSNHPLLDPRTLEAEATGLLDRMLGVLQDNSVDALIVDATLNCLSILLRSRPGTTNRILNTVLGFNPLKLANSPMTSRTRVLVKSMEKTTRMLLVHVSKRDPHNPHAARIQQHVERLVRSRTEILDDAGRKRALPDQGLENLDPAKRQKLLAAGVRVPPPTTTTRQQLEITPLKPGPHSLADVFTFGSDGGGVRSFDVTALPLELVTRINVLTLASVDPAVLLRAVQGVRDRLASFAAAQPAALNPDTAPLGVDADDDDDDYEPDYYAAEDSEQILNKLDAAGETTTAAGGVVTATSAAAAQAPAALGAFGLPVPPPLTPELTARAGQLAVRRVFGTMRGAEETPAVAALSSSSAAAAAATGARKPTAGINRLAGVGFDKEAWVTVIARLATRAAHGLEDVAVKDEAAEEDSVAAAAKKPLSSVGETIRESLFAYVLEDFRRRIEPAVSWLSEEWYNDQLEKKRNAGGGSGAPMHYEKWALKLLDGFAPYLAPQDKVLTRFLGEVPELSRDMLRRVKNLCRDPSLVPLTLTSLVYLVMMRPPVKEDALDMVQDIWTEFEDARPLATKYLTKWRPQFLEAAKRLEEDRAASQTGAAPIAA